MTTAIFKHIDTTTYTGKPWGKVDTEGYSYKLKDVERAVHNIRGREDQFSTDNSGFAVYNSPANEKLFTDDKAVREGYYAEVEDLLRKNIKGIKKVHIFDHTIRRKDKSSPRQPVQQVHVDQTPGATDVRVRRHLPAEEAEELLQGRYQIINVWRPIGNPASDFPLAVVDFRSTEPKDFVPVDLMYPVRSDSAMDDDDRGKERLPDPSKLYSTEGYEARGETLGVAANENHKFYYMKDMTPDEVMLLKCYDSFGTGEKFEQKGIATRTPHTAFFDPNTPADAPGRQSIEVRCLVFYETSPRPHLRRSHHYAKQHYVQACAQVLKVPLALGATLSHRRSPDIRLEKWTPAAAPVLGSQDDCQASHARMGRAPDEDPTIQPDEDATSRKTKCDGARPACSRCINRSKTCVYDAEPDEYRATALRRKCKMWEDQALAGEQMLLALRDLPEDESVNILRRLRQKENVEDILESLSNYDSQSNDRRARVFSDAASQGSARSAATSSGSTQEGSTSPSQIQQVSQKVQFTASDGRPEREHRSKAHDRLAIDFLVNNNAGDDPKSSNHQLTQNQIGKSAAHSPLNYNRMHSYPPLALSQSSIRRVSAPLPMVIDSRSVAAQASEETRLAADGSGAPDQNMEWDNYFTTVSRLMKKMGQQEPDQRQQ